jgi:endonuclease/exonuclease/phosphatase family metal-dependent hydrolase
MTPTISGRFKMRKQMQAIKLRYWVFPCLLSVSALFPNVPIRAEETVSVMFQNLCNYFVEGEGPATPKTEDARRAVVATMASVRPDVLLLAEIGSDAAVSDLRRRLASAGLDYPWWGIVKALDPQRRVAYLSTIRPAAFLPVTEATYPIRPKSPPGKTAAVSPTMRGVSRGFLHLILDIAPAYRLHLITAHFKSRLPHPRFDESEMRDGEANVLVEYIGNLLVREPAANVLVVGDMNDVYPSRPIRRLVELTTVSGPALFDLRPCDAMGAAWTHWWERHDRYGRIDYAFASRGILPEIVHSSTRIPHLPEAWQAASDHRPLLVTILVADSDPLLEERIGREFPAGIRRHPLPFR